MFDEIKKSFGVSPAKAVTPPSPKMDDSDVEIVPPLDPAAYPAPPDSLVSPGPKPVKVSKIESYVFPRFDTVDTTAKKGTRDMLDAFADVWGSHPLVFMQPLPALTKLSWDGNPVDIGGARFKHAPASAGDDWMLPASSGRLGKVSWLLDKGIPLEASSGLTALVLGRGIELHKMVNMVGLVQRAYIEGAPGSGRYVETSHGPPAEGKRIQGWRKIALQ